MIKDVSNIQIAVICEEDQIKYISTGGQFSAGCLGTGANFVGSDDLIEKIKDGWLDFDILFITPEMMPKVGTLSKILGPVCKMPNVKNHTIASTDEINHMIKFTRSCQHEALYYNSEHFGAQNTIFYCGKYVYVCGRFKAWITGEIHNILYKKEIGKENLNV